VQTPRAVDPLHPSVARCERVLSSSRFLCGDTVSEADVRLLPTAVRFDGVYASFFRCGRKLIRSDYDHTRRWMHEMLGLVASASQGSAPADRLTLFDLALARRSYYANLFPLNPGGIVPAGPTEADLRFPDAEAAVAAPDETAFALK